MLKLSDKQENFCREYIIDCNASQAYIRAGYSSRGASKLSSRMMAKDGIQKRISELMAKKEDAQIAKADEVLKYLTRVMRGETIDETLDREGFKHDLKVAERDRLKAAELLGKRYMLFTEKMDLNSGVTIIIKGEEDLEG